MGVNDGVDGFSFADLADCADREVNKRLQVYPRQVYHRHMTQAQADRQVAMMKAIAKLLRQRAESAGRLFP